MQILPYLSPPARHFCFALKILFACLATELLKNTASKKRKKKTTLLD